jgi:hypothetical protein
VCDTVQVVFFTPVTCAKRAHLENGIWYSCCLVGLFGWQTKGAMFLEMKFWTSTSVSHRHNTKTCNILGMQLEDMAGPVHIEILYVQVNFVQSIGPLCNPSNCHTHRRIGWNQTMIFNHQQEAE